MLILFYFLFLSWGLTYCRLSSNSTGSSTPTFLALLPEGWGDKCTPSQPALNQPKFIFHSSQDQKGAISYTRALHCPFQSLEAPGSRRQHHSMSGASNFPLALSPLLSFVSVHTSRLTVSYRNTELRIYRNDPTQKMTLCRNPLIVSAKILFSGNITFMILVT